jgi:ribosomal protein S18 acetylase RimI-like enzyme
MEMVLKIGLKLTPVSPHDRESFTTMAVNHFRELNSEFEAQADWNQYYFQRIISNGDLRLCWIEFDGERAGFILFGLEDHKFLPRKIGAIYELYIEPRFRRRGIARRCAELAIHELRGHSPSKIQLEIMDGNTGALKLWKSLGFQKICERWVLKDSTS